MCWYQRKGSLSHSPCEKPSVDSICGLTYASPMPPSREAMKTTAGNRSTSERYFNSSVKGDGDGCLSEGEFTWRGLKTDARLLSVASASSKSTPGPVEPFAFIFAAMQARG